MANRDYLKPVFFVVSICMVIVNCLKSALNAWQFLWTPNSIRFNSEPNRCPGSSFFGIKKSLFFAGNPKNFSHFFASIVNKFTFFNCRSSGFAVPILGPGNFTSCASLPCLSPFFNSRKTPIFSSFYNRTGLNGPLFIFNMRARPALVFISTNFMLIPIKFMNLFFNFADAAFSSYDLFRHDPYLQYGLCLEAGGVI